MSGAARVLLWGAVVLSEATTARADDAALPTTRLHYRVDVDAASTCPDERGFRRQVAVRLGYDPFVVETSGAEPPRELDVDVTMHSARKVTVRLIERGRELGRREIVPPPRDCEELVQNAAFAASLAIDPRAASRPPPPNDPAALPAPVTATPTPAPSVSAPQPTGTEPARPHNSETRREPWLTAARVGPTVAFGVLPATAIGGQIGGSARHQALSIEVAARYEQALASRVATNGAQVTTIHSLLLAGEVAVCGHAQTGRASPFACAAFQAGTLRAAAEGPSATRDVAIHLALAPRIGVSFALTDSLSLDARAETPLALAPAEIRLDGQSVWNASTFSARLGVGATWTFR